MTAIRCNISSAVECQHIPEFATAFVESVDYFRRVRSTHALLSAEPR
jgi:hypothetical protein